MKTILCFIFSVLFLLLLIQETSSSPTAKGKLVTVKVHSQGLEGNLFNDAADRNVTVYLPPGYNEDPERSYPVLYLLPWENSSDRDWFRIAIETSFKEILDNCIRFGKIKPMIVVVPDSKNKLNGCWYTDSEVTGNWENYIVHDVVNYIDDHFRTLPFSECRGIAGHSMGGYGALKLGTKHPEVFSSVYSLNAFVDFKTFMNDEYIWINSIVTAMKAGSIPSGDPLADRLLAMTAAFAPNANNPPFLGNFFRNPDGKIDQQTAEKWLEHDPLQMISSYSENLKKLKALTIDCSNSDANIYLNSNYSEELKRNNIAHNFSYYSGNDEKQLATRARNFMLPLFSETLSHSFLTISNFRHCYSQTDKLKAELISQGNIYVVPNKAIDNLEEMEASKLLSFSVLPGQKIEMPLKKLSKGIYRIYGVSSEGFIDKPVVFGINEGIPTVKICAADSYTGEEICCCLTVNDVTCPEIPAGGFVMSAMGTIDLCLSRGGYCSVEKSVTIYTDTTIVVPMAKDSYLKVIDKASKKPVFEATVTHNKQATLTNRDGITCIQNLLDGKLNCRIFNKNYFTELVSIPLNPGETATVEVTSKKAQVNFILVNDHEPVPGMTVLLNEEEAVTDENGQATFSEVDARAEHNYTINSSCYEKVNGSLILETDTTIYLTLRRGITGTGMPIHQSLEQLLITPALDGTFYIVPEGTEPFLEAVKKKFIWKQEVFADVSLRINLKDFPGDVQYWLYFVAKECGPYLKSGQPFLNVSEIAAEEVIIYPNPAREMITILFNQPQRFTVEIMNVHGKKLYQSQETGISHKVDLLSFSSGIYFVHVKSDDFTVTQKVLKQ
jgi:S-formylglutathione hydrolase